MGNCIFNNNIFKQNRFEQNNQSSNKKLIVSATEKTLKFRCVSIR